MFISIPKEFFVPVLFNDKFELNIEKNTMEYDSERENGEYRDSSFSNVSRIYLSDNVDSVEDDESRQDQDFASNYFENIKDKEIEEQVVKYINGFIRFIRELKSSNCLGSDEKESIRLVNLYGKKFKDIYNMYKAEVLNVRRPLTPMDVDAFVDYYVDKIADLYNETLASLNCKTLNYDSIEAVIDDILNDAREILRDQIENLNCSLVNKSVKCKSEEDIKKAFENGDNQYKKIDNEYVTSTSTM